MTKEELHVLLERHNTFGNSGDELYFSFASENEEEYLLSLYEDLSKIKGYENIPKSELVLDVRGRRLFDWGKISHSYYKLNGIIHHLDFSTREEKNIELNVQINKYTGKLSISFEALQQLKQGAKLKLL